MQETMHSLTLIHAQIQLTPCTLHSIDLWCGFPTAKRPLHDIACPTAHSLTPHSAVLTRDATQTVEDLEDEDGDEDDEDDDDDDDDDDGEEGGYGVPDQFEAERTFFAAKLDEKSPSYRFDADGVSTERQLRLAQVALGPGARGGPFTLEVTVEMQSEMLDEGDEPEEPAQVTCVLCTLIPGKVSTLIVSATAASCSPA
jgi:hypothetical protein